MSSVSSQVANDELQLDSWPRRLLHVPTLTSYNWQPGNRYGNAVKPAYNILTYTWGRWELADTPVKEGLEVESIPVKQVPWNIPRIDPNHFTTAQFLHVIRRQYPIDSMVLEPDVEFVRVDVACLNQTQGHPTSNSERGRQVGIFSRAT